MSDKDGTRTLHLVRHGEVENPAGIRYGRLPGFRLSDQGRAHSAEAARHLASMTPRPQRLLTSPLQRARETASAIGAELGIEPQVEPNLIEVGSWLDGLPRRSPGLGAVWRQWRTRSERTAAEPLIDVLERVSTVIRQRLEEVSTLVVVSHETPIWLARLAFEHHLTRSQGPLKFRWAPWLAKQRCAPASITTLVFSSGFDEVQVRYWEPS